MMTYDALHAAFRTWSSSGDGYDFNGVVHLLIAALDNLREHALDAELQDIGESFRPDQAAFLLRLARIVEAPPDRSDGDP